MDESSKLLRSPGKMLAGLVLLGVVLIGAFLLLAEWAAERSELNAVILSLRQELDRREREYAIAVEELRAVAAEMDRQKATLREGKLERDKFRLELAINRLAIGAINAKDTKSSLMDLAALRNFNLEFKRIVQQEIDLHQRCLTWDPDAELPEKTYLSRIRELEKQLAAEQRRNKELTEALEKVKQDR